MTNAKSTARRVFPGVALALAGLLLASGCIRQPGQTDILYVPAMNPPSNAAASLSCSGCHAVAGQSALNPLVTAAATTNGKHRLHAGEYGIACERCHYGAMTNAFHMNGMQDAADPYRPIVHFEPALSNVRWGADTNARAGSCSGASNAGCHTMLPVIRPWYSNQ